MKKCKCCFLNKSTDEFYAIKGNRDGLSGKCKSCTKKHVRENSKKVGRSYDMTEKGVVRVIYKTQKRNNLNRGHGELPYSKEEFRLWLYQNGFKSMYEKWKGSGFLKDMKPSVDRLDTEKGYSFCNIRLVTWLENRMSQYIDMKTGCGSSGKSCKKVGKYNKDDELVAVYVSYNSAYRDMGYSLEKRIKKGDACKNGFFWKYV